MQIAGILSERENKMGEWYTIGLQAGRNVATKVDAFIKSQHKSDSYGENFDPEAKRTLSDGSTTYRWYMKRDPFWFKDEKELVGILDSFDDLNEDEDDAYKLVAIGDKGGRDERGNEIGYDTFDGLYGSSVVEFPDSFETSEDAVQVEQALIDCDCDVSAEVLADAIAQADTSMTFEALATSYVGGDASFRKGMDNALFNLFGLNMRQLADKVSAA